MDIREQIARAIFFIKYEDFPAWEAILEKDKQYWMSIADKHILALPDLPENIKRLKLYPKLVEALDFLAGEEIERVDDICLLAIDRGKEALAKAKKLEKS